MMRGDKKGGKITSRKAKKKKKKKRGERGGSKITFKGLLTVVRMANLTTSTWSF